MSVDRFRFVSPGIFIEEIDQSQIPQLEADGGPAIVGRTLRGPAMRPVTVSSFSEFVDTFGEPVAGNKAGDVWRDGNLSAPTYASYAAQAYLRNSAPVTVVRLLGAQHASAAQKSAKAGWHVPRTTATGSGGVYGLFIVGSGSAGTSVSGALAAVWYLNNGAKIALSGNMAGTNVATSSNAVFFDSQDSSNTFKVVIKDAGSTVIDTSFNFDRGSSKYIRKVFNTNPQLTNGAITAGTAEAYWLGETFERHLNDNVASGTNYGVILGLGSGSAGATSAGDFRLGYQLPETPPIIGQDLTTDSGSYKVNNQQELFTVVARDDAEWTQNNLKISIVDVKDSQAPDYDPYGTFGLQVRRIDDKDTRPQIVEQFNNLSLNPNSPNFIAARIGDREISWDDTEKRNREYGEFDNQSKYIRISVNRDVAAGATDPRYLPFGFKGVVKFTDFRICSGSRFAKAYGKGVGASAGADTDEIFALGAENIHNTPPAAQGTHNASVAYFARFPGTVFGGTPTTASVLFPSIPLRHSGTDGGVRDGRDAYFGYHNGRTTTSTLFEESIRDIARMVPAGFSGNRTNPSGVNCLERGPGFSLDNLIYNASQRSAYYSGSARVDITSTTDGGGRSAGTSMTAASSSYTEVLDRGFNRFTVPFFGGFDGLDVTEKEPFRNTQWTTTTSELNDAMYYSVKRAIDTVADPDQVDINLLAAPGITHSQLTDHMIQVAEERADTLAVIDLESGYTSSYENSDVFSARAGDVASTVASVKNRSFNSSYGAAYYPWVQVRDRLNGTQVWVPPSVVALGVYANSERNSELWFAPAGFNRGGLSQGAAGLPVTNVVDKLTSKHRDDLYAVNVNPIASFPAEGIVVFGQKTLQATPSALDRINVRRLLIFLKKRISRIASQVLFDANVDVTWNRFIGQVEPFLRDVKSRFGLTEFRVVLDETTTTPDLVDRNILYAKILLKPTRAIEFIALDFVITRSGASFDD
tara:strand:+ start:6495 stop:9431 length:2937 start_codon:yes stop_codon:yes gene_type:complete